MAESNASGLTEEEVENFLSSLSEDSFENRMPVVVYLSLISTIGFFGTTLVLFVYGFKFQPSATRTFILFMALLDFITNTLGLPLQILTIRFAYNDGYWLCRSFFGVATLSTQASGFILVLVALDRVWRICAPMKKQLNSRQAFYFALGTVCFSVMIFAPFIPFYGIHRIDTNKPGIQARMCWSEDEYKDTVYLTAYKITVAVSFFAGLSIMGVSYICIGIKLWKKQVEKKRSVRDMRRLEALKASAADGAGMPAILTRSPLAETGAGTIGASHSDDTSTGNQAANSSILGVSETDPPKRFDLSDAGKFTVTQTLGANVEMEEVCCSQTATDVSYDADSSVKSNEHKFSCPEEQKKSIGMKKNHASVCTRRMRSRTTTMMFVLTLFYIINWLPHLVMRSVRSDPVNWCPNLTDCGSNTYAIVIRSYYVNSAINAFVYSFCSVRFRQKCQETFFTAARKLSFRK